MNYIQIHVEMIDFTFVKAAAAGKCERSFNMGKA